MLDRITKFLDNLADISEGIIVFALTIFILGVLAGGIIYLGLHFPVMFVTFILGCLIIFLLLREEEVIDEEKFIENEDKPKTKTQLKMYRYKGQNFVPHRIEMYKDGKLQAEYFRNRNCEFLGERETSDD